MFRRIRAGHQLSYSSAPRSTWHMVKTLAIIGALALGACGTFQSADIVVDLRTIAMTATVPEQVVDVDLQNPPMPSDILPQLVPSTVCALVADPSFDRRLRYTLTLCIEDNGGGCGAGAPNVAPPHGGVA